MHANDQTWIKQTNQQNNVRKSPTTTHTHLKKKTITIKKNRKIDYYQDEWYSGNDSPLNASLIQKNVPMPTLYSSAEGHAKQPAKSSLTHLVFYNMASILASVAVGYDVRMSNVSPVHPKLQPLQSNSEARVNGNDEHNSREREHYYDCSSRVHNEYGMPQRNYQHNTYHGPTKHVR